MNEINSRLTDESGAVLVLALLMLVFLTLIGIAATTSTSIELQIAQNERIYQENFNAAEAAAFHAIQWVADASTGDLQDYDNFDFHNNYKDSPWNGDDEEALADFRNPENWVWTGTDPNADPVPVEDAGGNLQYPNTYFAVVYAGTSVDESMDETAPDVVQVYHCFGLYRATAGARRGEVVVEIGFKRRS